MATRTRRSLRAASKRPSSAALTKLWGTDRDEAQRATVRLGETPEKRLNWVIAFAMRDLNVLRREELMALGYDLRALPAPGWQGVRHVGPMSEPELIKLQGEIRVGIERFLTTPHGWQLPPPRSARLCRTANGTGRPRAERVWEGGERETIIAAVADLVIRCADRLRACMECRRPFVAVKRQEYCSTACSQRTRDRRKRERKA